MTSIRRSVLFNLVVLLALVLLGVGVVIDRLAGGALEARRESAEALRRARFDDQAREATDARDQAMLNQARILASLTRSQTQWPRLRALALSPLGVITATAAPQGHVLVPLWLAESVRGPVSSRLFRLSATELQFSEDELTRDRESDHPEFYQVTTEWGNAWRSRSLAGLSLPDETPELKRGPLFEWQSDDLTLANGVRVRRLVLKAPLVRVRYLWPGRPPGPPPGPPPGREERVSVGGRPERREPREPREPPDRVSEGTLPNIFVQCAWESGAFDREVAHLAEARDADLAALAADAEASRLGLRLRLAAIGAVAFGGLMLGGWTVIGTGLRPLRQLSDAVSRVSERDFRLPIDGAALPGELNPIAERMSQTLAQLQQAFEREKQATADISHELRTPVAALMTTLDVTLRKTRDAETYRESLEDCRAITRQLSALVERVMTLACLDANTARFQARPVAVSPLLDACATVIRPLAEGHGLTLRVQREPDLSVVTDPDKLREALLNLLHNAVEYNRPGGEVVLEARRDGGTLALAVRDTGIGISAEQREHIFERFYRSDASRTATGVHAGLGLSIVREYVQRLGGEIVLESTPGVGSCFRIRLPLGE